MNTNSNSKSRKVRTPEQKRAEMEALHEKLAEGVEALRASSTWTDYLAFCRSFHRYSFSNLMLILLQSPEATRVAGYRSWQEKGRQVRKGERGIRILGTGTVKVDPDTETDEQDEDEKGRGRRRVFFPVSVFDISQTEPMEGVEDVTDITPPIDGEDHGAILEKVTTMLTARGVEVSVEPIERDADGYTTPAKDGQPIRVVIDSTGSPAAQAATALHEAAHIELGHVAEDFTEYATHRGRCEVEAESVAYVLAGMLGLDTTQASTGYVAGWMERADADVLKTTAARVLAAVHSIADALDPATDEQDEQAA